ncbi:hypothetical protein [Pengzhenrongella phosphoraccumulans]|uniref:hypothetical protein n=1 Tax=Pengzhenrongella phosphoraccumulans TaxID=3114394 RepID=UPI00388E8790
MNETFEGSLRELAAGASTAHAARATAGAGLPLGQITTRVRRRRAVRAAAGATASVTAVTALVLGGAVLRHAPSDSAAQVASQPQEKAAIMQGIEIIHSGPSGWLILALVLFAATAAFCGVRLVLARRSGATSSSARQLVLRLAAGIGVVGLIVSAVAMVNSTRDLAPDKTLTALEQHYGLTFDGSTTTIPADGGASTVQFFLDEPTGAGTLGAGALRRDGNRVQVLQLAPGPGGAALTDSQAIDQTGAISEMIRDGSYSGLVEMSAK